jgi:GntR family transcriptional regulator
MSEAGDPRLVGPRRRIDRTSPVPFYYQLEQILLGEIRAGRRAAGDRLPSEHELCATYGVSRTVVRQALADLEKDGRIRRRKGQGSFVAPVKVSESLVQSLTGLHEDVTARGGTLRSEIRQLESVPASAVVAAELQLAEGEPVIALERLRHVNDLPWVLVTTYIPYHLCPQLLHEDLRERSLYALLEDAYGIEIAHGYRSVEATTATATLARLLGIKAGDPILLLRSTSYSSDGTPVEHFVAHHRGDLSRFQVHLPRRRVSSPAPTMVPSVPATAATGSA